MRKKTSEKTSENECALRNRQGGDQAIWEKALHRVVEGV